MPWKPSLPSRKPNAARPQRNHSAQPKLTLQHYITVSARFPNQNQCTDSCEEYPLGLIL